MEHKTNGGFHEILKDKADQFAFKVYQATKGFPKEEIYGLTSQLRRSALSVPLNIIEGYARIGRKEYSHFLQISFASLKEAKYLLFFSKRENYLKVYEYETLINLSEELGAMPWSTIFKIDKSNKK